MDPKIIADIADELPAGIWVARVPGGELLYVNDTFREIMGMDARPDVKVGEYAQPYGICDQQGRPYPEERMPFVRALQERRTVVVDDIVIHRTDGTRVHVSATAKPVFDAGGELTHIVIAFFDVSRERLATRARDQAEHHLRAVVNGAPIVLWAIDAKGIITLSEGQGLKRLGFRPGEIIGRSVFELYKDMPDILDSTRRALGGETQFRRQWVGDVAFESRLEPIRDVDGRVIGAVGVATDITEQQNLTTQLAQADRQVSMGRLAASVAHEVNSPLQYVLSSLQLAEDHLDDPAALRRCLADARDGIQRVKRIASDLRTFARPDLERRTAVTLRPVIESALRMCSVETEHRASVVEQYGPCPAVYGNEARLGQVFLNLILNAGHAIQEGDSRRNEIRISTATDSRGWAVVEVSDTGMGIAPDVLPRIFQPFFSTKPVGLGSGLGLAVSKSIVDGLGGQIVVSSTPGAGSTFRVELPPFAGIPVAEPPPVALEAPARARILIIDDDANLARVLATTLAEHDTRLATSGEDGLRQLLAGGPFDLILCDVMMKDLSAMDLYEQVKSQRPGLENELVLMTGGAFTPRARSFLDNVPNVRIEKPFDVRAFVAQRLNEKRRG